ncbi:MAG: M56 family metallopeptidase [Planctomycetota bacterium]|nr:M56 family metallopeptidase [Planctomycetota bacterium]
MIQFLQWLAAASIQGALLAGCVWLLIRCAGDHLAPRWRCLLWSMVLIRMALPMAPASPWSLWSLAAWTSVPAAAPRSEVSPTPTPLLPLLQDIPTTAVTAEPAAAAGGKRIESIIASRSVVWDQWWGVVFGLWIAGAASMVFRVVMGRAQLRDRLKSSEPVRDAGLLEVLEACRERMRVRRRIELVESARFTSPAVVGWLKPRIVLPRGFAASTRPDGIRAVLLHECAHITRHDIAAAWVASFILALHWFNPICWWVLRQMRSERELACDSAALMVMTPRERPVYGHTLLDLLLKVSGPEPYPSIAAMDGRGIETRRRMLMIAKFRPDSILTSVVAAAACLCVAVAGLTDAAEPPQKAQAEAASTSFGFCAKPYEADADKNINLGSGIRWHVQSRYMGVDAKGNSSVDERLTMVLQDQAKSFWPVIVKFTPEARAQFEKDLAQAIRIRQAVIKESAADCAPEPTALEAVLNFQGTALEDNSCSPFTDGRIAVEPMQASTAKQPIELNWLIATPKSPETNFGRVRMSMSDAQDLLQRIEAAAKQVGTKPTETVAPAREDSQISIYTRLLELDQFGASDLRDQFEIHAFSHYRGSDEAGNVTIDNRVTVVLANPAKSMWHMIAKLGPADASRFASELETAVAARKDDALAGTAATIATRPYTIVAPGQLAIPADVTIKALPAYTSSGQTGTIAVEKRVTIVIDDAKNNFYPMVVRLDAPAARALLEELKTAIAARSAK